MASHRHFLGRQQPLLHAAVAWLQQRTTNPATHGVWDLSHWILLTPGARSGRRLQELLAATAADRMLLPPEIITVGRLPELLYTPARPLVDDLSALLLWVESLGKASAECLESLGLTPDLVKRFDVAAEAAGDLVRLHDELGGEGLSFQDAAKTPIIASDDREAARWESLIELDRIWAGRLAELGLTSAAEARLQAARAGTTCCDRSIALLAAFDLPRIHRKLLETLETDVHALIPAEESEGHWFDGLGCVVPDAVDQITYELKDDQLVMVDRPVDQIQEVAARLTCRIDQQPALLEQVSADQITIGLGDPELGPPLARNLESRGKPARLPIASAYRDLGPARLLAMLASWCVDAERSAWCLLIRHPDIEPLLTGDKDDPGEPANDEPSAAADFDLLSLFDDYTSSHFPERIAPPWPDACQERALLDWVWNRITRLIGPELTPPCRTMRTLGQWSRLLLGALERIYAGRTLDLNQPADAMTAGVLTRLRDLLVEQIPEISHTIESPPITIAQAVSLTLGRLGQDGPAAPANPDAVDVLGWLELPLDDAPFLIITGFNEGFIPERISQDSFLPESVRRQLAIGHDRRRLARDVMAMRVLLSPWRQSWWIAGRRDEELNPLVPSRLMLRLAGLPLARRVDRFFSQEPETLVPPAIEAGHAVGQRQVMLDLRPPADLTAPASLSVTALSRYLRCPYQFMLESILRLDEKDDQADEMSPLDFGSFAHEVIAELSRIEPGEYRDFDALKKHLDHFSQQYLHRYFGDPPPVVLDLQREHLLGRLGRLLAWQLRQWEEGWTILHVELDLKQEIIVDRQPITLRGRVDRIDRNRDGSLYRIIDFKTGDKGKTPDETHRAKKAEASINGWSDLQLPLYQYLLRQEIIPAEAEVEAGYFLVSADSGANGWEPATWSEGEIEDAVSAAHEVIRAIRDGRFEPAVEASRGSESRSQRAAEWFTLFGGTVQ